MSNFSGYKTKTFSETQKFFVLDPQTGSPSFVTGSDLVSQLTPNSNYVYAENTRTSAQATDYDIGSLVQTAGDTAIADNGAAYFLVVAAGAGDFPMDNGNELLFLYDDDLLRTQLADNTATLGSDLIAHTGTTDTVTEALDKRTIYVGSVAELESLSLAVGTNVYLTQEGRAGSGVIQSGTPPSDPQKGVYIVLANGNFWERQLPSSGRLTPEMFGAKGDKVTDDIIALEAIVAFGEPFDLVSAYAISRKLEIHPVPEAIGGSGYLYFTGSGETAVQLGIGSENNSPKGLIRLFVERASEDETDTNVGLNIVNIFSSRLEVDARFFYRGVRFAGIDGGSCSYNTVNINRVQDAIESLELDAAGAAGNNGFVNQNTFIAGRIGNSKSSTLDLRAIVLTNDSGAGINGNVFLNPNFELNNTGTGTSVAMFGRTNTGQPDVGRDNKILGGRIENTKYLLGGMGLTSNRIELGRSGYAETVAADVIQPGSALELLNNIFDLSDRKLYSAEALKIGGFTRQNVVQNTPGANPYATAPADGALFQGDTFYNDRPGALTESILISDNIVLMGMLFDLSGVQHDFHKRIDLRPLLSADGGRIAAVFYDAAGTKLTGNVSNLFYYSTAGFHRGGADMTRESAETAVYMSDSVAYAFIGITKGGTDALFTGIDYFCRADSRIKLARDTATYASLTTVSGLRMGADKTPVSDVIPDPVAGDQEGVFCRKGNAVSTDPMGWYRTSTAWISGPVLP